MRPAPRLILLTLIAAALTVVLTLAFENPSTAVTILWATLALSLIADTLTSPPPRRMTAQVHAPAAGMVGVPIPLKITLEGPATPTLCLEMDAELGPPTQTQTLTPSRRGIFHLRALHLQWPSRFGLLEIQTRLPLNLQITVVPDIGPVTSGLIQTQMLPLLQGQKDMRLKGIGSEFHQLRDFAPGMDLRQVDWKRSARLRSMVARETRAERNHQVILAVDSGYLMSERIAGLPKLDRAINAALALAWAAGLGGDLVGFYAFDSQPRQFLPPLPGRAGFPRLQAAAAALNYADQETNHTLGLSHLLSRLRRRSLIIVFSDFVDSITAQLLVENVTLLTRHHLVLFVALRDPALTTIAAPATLTLNSIAESVAATQILTERQSVMDRLSRLGVLCLDVPPAALTAALVSKYIDIKAGELI